MASVGTGQYLVDGTRGAAVVPSKWPRWLYGAINPEKTLRHKLFQSVSPQRWQLEHQRHLCYLVRFLWGQIIFQPQRPKVLFKKFIRTLETSLADLIWNPQRPAGRHMRSHIIIKVFPSYPLLSLSISTWHITKTSGGRRRINTPDLSPQGYVHCSLHVRSWEANTIGWWEVSCDFWELSLYLWLRLKLRWSKGNNDPWCERQC